MRHEPSNSKKSSITERCCNEFIHNSIRIYFFRSKRKQHSDATRMPRVFITPSPHIHLNQDKPQPRQLPPVTQTSTNPIAIIYGKTNPISALHCAHPTQPTASPLFCLPPTSATSPISNDSAPIYRPNSNGLPPTLTYRQFHSSFKEGHEARPTVSQFTASISDQAD